MRFRHVSSVLGVCSLLLLQTPFSPAQVDPDDQAVTAFNQGERYWHNGDWDKAVAHYTAALQLNPRYAEAFCRRGWAYHTKNDQDAAISDLTAAISIKSKYAMAYRLRGSAYYAKGDLTKAESDFAAVKRLEPMIETPLPRDSRQESVAVGGANRYDERMRQEQAGEQPTPPAQIQPAPQDALRQSLIVKRYSLEQSRKELERLQNVVSTRGSNAILAQRIAQTEREIDALQAEVNRLESLTEAPGAESPRSRVAEEQPTQGPFRGQSALLTKQLADAEPPEIGPLTMDLRPSDLDKVLCRKLGRKLVDPTTNTMVPADHLPFGTEGFVDWGQVELLAGGRKASQKHQVEFREFHLSHVETEYGFPKWVDRVTCYFASERLYKIQLGYAFCERSAEAGQAGQRLLGRPLPAVSKNSAEEAERALLQQLGSKYDVRKEPFADMIQLDSVPADAELTAVFGDPTRVEAGRRLLLQRGEAPDALNYARIVQGRFVMPYSYRIHGKVDPDGEYERLFEDKNLVVAVDTSRWDVISREADGSVSLARRFVRVTYIWRPFVEQLGKAYTTAKLNELEQHAK